MTPLDSSDDPVADLYDGFVRRLGEPGVADEIERDIAWRRDALRSEHRAGARIARVIPLAASFVLPATRRESARMALFWGALGSMVLLFSIAGWRASAAGMACGVAVFAVPAVLGLFVFLSGIDLLIGRARHGLCRGCAYEVASLPPALDPALTFGETAGPARCPECGLRWPLVPRSR